MMMTTPVFLPEEIVFEHETIKPINIEKLEEYTKDDLGHLYMFATNKDFDIQFYKKAEIIQRLRSCEKFIEFVLINNREYGVNFILDES